MTETSAGPVEILDDDESRQRLRENDLGRLVTRVRDVLDVFPVSYVLDGDDIVFRTAEGSKLLELTINEDVLFEVDHVDDEIAWSVVVRGRARRLETSAEVEAADALPLRPLVPTLKYHYVRVAPVEISGRLFARGEEPDRYGIASY